ncbi:PREDICTED: serine-threonine kinase receptor-associated protein-like [Lupinus angustifolius]|nr:PREDICTED: serine-threonine kinase receptor-associated protein-like [Lupinus angustifolius]
MGGVRLWDVRSGKIVQTLETKLPVTSAEVSQDGHYITTVDGSTVKFWDANHYGLVKSYDMPCTMESASLEPKYRNKFIAAGEDMWIHVFDFHTGNEIACNKGHHGPVHCVRFSPGGESYASGSEDGTIRIWQTPLSHDAASEALSANESIEKGMKISADEVSHKIESFHIADEGKSKESEQAGE